jgi:hypothetical protein
MSASCAIQNVKQRKLEDIEGVIRRLNVKTIQVPEEKDKHDSGREKKTNTQGTKD